MTHNGKSRTIEYVEQKELHIEILLKLKKKTSLHCSLFTSITLHLHSQMSNGSEDSALYVDGAAKANITRLHKATPPLTGTFDAAIYGSVAEGNFHRHASFSRAVCHLVLTGSYYTGLNGFYEGN